ncbi:hypothetical protein GCT13_10805 [Paraburkholderia sp. CNPSo 3157]|uniref:EpsG family protein n=1 Tax=Paraburkholderia franconis TaxID=2654983 RepID=A0A7X1N8M6_9BURK|nr:EpsG family protein [Paraburkholderia franconis]MPW17409.1 hypothetical protein [Paraburkholderia franconis]
MRTAVSRMSGETSAGRVVYIRRYWLTPTAWIFALLAATMLLILWYSDRTSTLSDQDNYLEYFRQTNWDWLVTSFHRRSSIIDFAVDLFTDEFGWRAWIIFINGFGLSAELGVRITVVVSNALLVYSFSRLRRPLLGLILWLIIPVAFATLVFQIRQGFAFSVFVFLAVMLRRPLLGALIASSVHTTFAVPAIILIAVRLFEDRQMVALFAGSMAGVVVAAAGQTLFRHFGSYRIDVYAGYQDNFSIRLLGLVTIYVLAPVMVLCSQPRQKNNPLDVAIENMSIMTIGLIVYLAVAYFVFPFGKDRVWYYVPLMLCILVPQIKFRNAAMIWMTAGVLGLVATDAIKNYFEGTYAYFLG